MDEPPEADPPSTTDALGYRHRTTNPLNRAMQHAAESRPGAWLLTRTLQRSDKLLLRATRGRQTFTGLLAGLPVITLTTTGAKSGQPRTTPLLGVPMNGDVAVIGSNFGQRPTPGWVFNLEADPTAAIGYRGRTVTVRARAADPDETDAVFAEAGALYPGYATYRERASHRRIRVFILSADTSERGR